MIDLTWFFGETTRDEFAERYWDRSACVIRGPISRFDAFGFSLSSLKPLDSRTDVEVKAVFTDGQGFPQELRIDAREASTLYKSGFTICFGFVDKYVPALRQACAAIQSELRYPGLVHMNAFLSPPGRGLFLHFDHMPVMVLQIEGEKRWRYTDWPALPHPIDGSAANEGSLRAYSERFPWATLRVPEPSELEDVTLAPGDALFLPPGFWHQTCASDYSLSLTLTFTPIRRLDAVLDSIGSRLVSDARWRRSCPLGSADPAEESRQLARLEADLLRQIADEHEPSACATAEAPRRTVERGDHLRVAHPTQLANETDATGEPELVLTALATDPAGPVPRPVGVHADARRVVERMLERRSFVAAEVIEWAGGDDELSWEEAEDFLGSLCEAGLLVREHMRAPAPA